MNNIKNMLAPSLSFFIVFFSLFISQNAKADFRKAVDAYIARDGAALLREVNDAIQNNNNKGLGLFLSAMTIDDYASQQKNVLRIWLAADKSKYVIPQAEVKTTLNTILTTEQKEKLFSILQKAVDNDSPDIQYRFFVLAKPYKTMGLQNWLKAQKEFAQKGSGLAKIGSAHDLAGEAEADLVGSQMNLGFKYLNFESDLGYGCQSESKEIICQTKDEVKGYYWLKRALKVLENNKAVWDWNDVGDMSFYASEMCDFFHRTANGDAYKLKQAYLWCVVGVNSGSWSSWRLLKNMQDDGTFKVAVPEDDGLWKTNFEVTTYKERPDWLVEVQKTLPSQGAPIFSYYFSDYRITPYLLDIYPDGRVNITFNFFPFENGDLWVKVSPKVVKNFLKDLNKLDFNYWNLFTTSFQFCDNFDPCIWTQLKVTQRDGDKIRKVQIKEPPYLADLDKNENYGLGILRIAKLQTLVEKYFPTQKIRCELGNSESFNKACIERDKRWAVLSEKPQKK